MLIGHSSREKRNFWMFLSPLKDGVAASFAELSASLSGFGEDCSDQDEKVEDLG